MTALTITFAAWWIPTIITAIWLLWAIYMINTPSTGWLDLTAVAVIISFIIPLVAWLIYFIIN